MSAATRQGRDFDAIVVGSGLTGGWAAKELTELVISRIDDDDVSEIDHAKGARELRPLIMEGVRVLFAQAMQGELRELTVSGRTAKVARRRRRR